MVISPVDLNLIPMNLNQPLKEAAMKDFTFDFTSKVAYMSVSIPQRAYCPGERIIVTVNVDNTSRTRIKSVRVSLNKVMVLKR